MNILDPRFKYVNAVSTDLRKTFARLRRQHRQAGAPAEAAQAPRDSKVVALDRGRKTA